MAPSPDSRQRLPSDDLDSAHSLQAPRDVRPVRSPWGRKPTANERLRLEAPQRLNRALILAAALHGSLFLFSPDWTRSALTSHWGTSASALQVVAMDLGDGGPDLGMDLPAMDGDPEGTGSILIRPLPEASGEGEAAGDEVASSPDEWGGGADGPAGGGGVGSGLAGGSGGVGLGGAGGRLGRLGALRPELRVPTAVEKHPESPDEGSEGEGLDAGAGGGAGEEGEVRDRRVRAELTDRLDDRRTREEILDLERLSALRPELALTSPSSWILVRNPGEVGEFLERRFGRPGDSQRPRGTLSVAIWIDERGSVEWAEINRSSGDPELDGAALELFERVVSFSPAREDGFRVPTAVIFWLSFW